MRISCFARAISVIFEAALPFLHLSLKNWQWQSKTETDNLNCLLKPNGTEKFRN